MHDFAKAKGNGAGEEGGGKGSMLEKVVLV